MTVPIVRGTSVAAQQITDRTPPPVPQPRTPTEFGNMTDADWRRLEGRKAPLVDNERRPLVGTRLANTLRPDPPPR